MGTTHILYIATVLIILLLCIFCGFRKFFLRAVSGFAVLFTANALGISANINIISSILCSFLGIPAALSFIAVLKILN